MKKYSTKYNYVQKLSVILRDFKNPLRLRYFGIVSIEKWFYLFFYLFSWDILILHIILLFRWRITIVHSTILPCSVSVDSMNRLVFLAFLSQSLARTDLAKIHDLVRYRMFINTVPTVYFFNTVLTVSRASTTAIWSRRAGTVPSTAPSTTSSARTDRFRYVWATVPLPPFLKTTIHTCRLSHHLSHVPFDYRSLQLLYPI